MEQADARERIQKLLVTGDNRLKQGVSHEKVRETYEEALRVARRPGSRSRCGRWSRSGCQISTDSFSLLQISTEGAMTDSLQKYLAELLGTFTLVFIGTTAILAATGEAARRTSPSAFAFGLALLAGLYAFADVSGGHFNPGVSLAMFLDKRLEMPHMIGYWISSWPVRCWARSACSSRSTRTRWR